MATLISGILKANTGFSIMADNYGRIEPYPLGRQLRGAFGYIAMDLGLDIGPHFPDLSWDGVLFRDLLPVCRCGREFKMSIGGDFVPCESCGDMYKNEYRQSRGKSRSFSEVREGRKYRLNVVVTDASFEHDIGKVMAFVETHGVRLGRVLSSGHGLFRLSDRSERQIAEPEGSRWLLYSDAVLPEGTRDVVMGHNVGGVHSVLVEKVIPRGTIIQMKHKGHYLGSLGGCGFGEAIVL